MGGFRARDADRDRVVEAIEAAYVDGQLSDVDRDLRVSQALTAASLDELEGLTRDLQVQVAPVMTRVAPGARAPRSMSVLVVLGIVLVLGGLSLALSLVTSSDTASDSGVVGVDPVVDESAAAEPETEKFEMTPAGVRAFLRAYEGQFGTLDAFEAGFYPSQGRVYAQVPVRGARPRFERWTWDGSAWSQDSEASAVLGVNEIVDLGALDVRRLLANTVRARRTLEVPRGEITHVLVQRWTDEDPSVTIYVANKFSESGHLRTTLSGEVTGSYPYTP